MESNHRFLDVNQASLPLDHVTLPPLRYTATSPPFPLRTSQPKRSNRRRNVSNRNGRIRRIFGSAAPAGCGASSLPALSFKSNDVPGVIDTKFRDESRIQRAAASGFGHETVADSRYVNRVKPRPSAAPRRSIRRSQPAAAARFPPERISCLKPRKTRGFHR